MLPSLANALAAAERAAWDEALEPLIQAWRELRAPRLAALVTRASALTLPTVREGGKPLELHERWLRDAEGADTVTIGRLLSTLLDATGSPQVSERLKAMRAWPDDPRVVDRAFELLETCPFRRGVTEDGLPFEGRAVSLLAQIEDPRTFDRAEVLVAKTARAEAWHPEAIVHRELGAQLTAFARVRPRRGLAPEELAVVEALESRVERALTRRSAEVGRGDELLAAIHADPTDDALRAVYADWLSERGDPRGELINLQLRRTGKPSARERELVALHGKQWLGPLANAVLKEGQRWERGFLAACVFGPKTKAAFAAADGHPTFTTVEALELRTWNRKGDAHWLLMQPVFRNLRAVRGLREEAVLEALNEGGWPHIRLRTLGFELQRAERRTKKAERQLAELTAFPHLEVVELTPHPDARPEAEALAATMKRFRVTLV
ncbi:MAG: TIGR02996 domain-containing protein [Myxococcales bacterium]|nr:TIGR02996 domain-containing protein [Myxococcales bacterium]